MDRANGLDDVRVVVAMLRVPGGQAHIEMIQFYMPADEQGTGRPLPNTLGIRHIAFAVENIEAIVAKLKQNGVECFSEIQDYEGR